MFNMTLDFKLTLHIFVYDTMHSSDVWGLMIAGLPNTLKDSILQVMISKVKEETEIAKCY